VVNGVLLLGPLLPPPHPAIVSMAALAKTANAVLAVGLIGLPALHRAILVWSMASYPLPRWRKRVQTPENGKSRIDELGW
jgi:hypothetical protein